MSVEAESRDSQGARGGEPARTPAGAASWLVVTAGLLHGLATWWLVYFVPSVRQEWFLRCNGAGPESAFEILYVESGTAERLIAVVLVGASVAYIGWKLKWRVAQVLVVQGLVYLILVTGLLWSQWVKTCLPP